jgi:molybdate transport system ATP-binding protein
VRDPSPSDPRRLAATFRTELGQLALDVHLDAPAAGVTALFGPSGAGKTTCLRVLAGLHRARGEVRVAGEVWQDDARGIFVPTHRRAVGLVFQDARLFPHLSVRDNLAYGRRRLGAGAGDERRLVDLLGIGSLMDRRPAHLSGGERQRVALARALVARPRLLLLDEPLASLDAQRKAEILGLIEEVRDALAIPIVYVSHALDEVVRLATWMAVLDGGAIAASGPLPQVLARLDLPMAAADDASSVLDARVAAHDEADALCRLDLGGQDLWVGQLARAEGQHVRVRVLARDVSLARQAPGPTSILNVLRGTVRELRDDGRGHVAVLVALEGAGATLLARVTTRSRRSLALEPGTAVYAMVKSVALVA